MFSLCIKCVVSVTMATNQFGNNNFIVLLVLLVNNAIYWYNASLTILFINN